MNTNHSNYLPEYLAWVVFMVRGEDGRGRALTTYSFVNGALFSRPGQRPHNVPIASEPCSHRRNENQTSLDLHLEEKKGKWKNNRNEKDSVYRQQPHITQAYQNRHYGTISQNLYPDERWAMGEKKFLIVYTIPTRSLNMPRTGLVDVTK